MPTVSLLIMLIVIFVLTLFDNIAENKKGGDSMSEIMLTKLNAKMLFKAIISNTLFIFRSVTATALSANAF